ncbi:hypothetical protein [Kibdelosporangium phytohabitans]|uniref:hypothetical protein n=1 Tax=Kibdelosporangium phytohabitans TaxID=860235 RepID=UPI0012FC493E|nr:hypothetical protein [Kibdelosporangium phytohabitans]MBE1468435.1 hypothetical protein [Kibdelosporangium phytohabitans]
MHAHKLNVIGAAEYALYVKPNTKRGGFPQNFRPRCSSRRATTSGRRTPAAFGPFTATNSVRSKDARVFDVSGLSNAPVKGLAAADRKFACVSGTTNNLKNADERKFTNVTVNGKPIRSMSV